MNIEDMSPADIKLCNSKLYDTYRNRVLEKLRRCEDEESRHKLIDEYARATEEWLLMANKGDAEAQYLLGVHHQLGVGMQVNFNEAERYYLQAAQQNHVEAQFALSQLYTMGANTPLINNKAGKRKSIEVGMVRNVPEEYRWLKKAAENGHCMAQSALSIMYYLGNTIDGFDKNDSEAFRWALEAAKQCDLSAMEHVAESYRSGRGVKKNIAKAIEWYTRAAEAGWTSSAMELGKMFYNGDDVQQDFRQAFEWFMPIAEKPKNKDGYADYYAGMAQYYVGVMYADGSVVQKDLIEASKWLSKAAENGVDKAYDRLANLDQKGLGGILKKIFG